MAPKHPIGKRLSRLSSSRVLLAIPSFLCALAASVAPAQAQSSVSVTFSGQKVSFPVSGQWVAFQVKPGLSPENTIRGLAAQSALQSPKTSALRLPQNAVAIPLSPGATAAQRNQLAARIQSATSIGRKLRVLSSNGQPVIETTDSIVKFDSGVSQSQIKSLLQKQGAILVGALGSWAPNTYRVRVSSANALASNVANGLLKSSNVAWAHPDFAVQPQFHATTNDPLFPNQWHLNNTGTGGGTVGADVKAPAAWDFAKGLNVKIAVSDDGIDTAHEDLKTRYITGRAFGDGTNTDPNPKTDDDNHGTSVAGLAMATGNNGIGVSGVAPEASLIGVRLGQQLTFALAADSFVWAMQQGADVINCSWGFPSLDAMPIPDVLGTAINTVTTSGRKGKGTIIVFSAGNSTADSRNGLNYHPRVITVAATTRQDRNSDYSNFGAAIDVAAPGGYGDGDMVTTDRTGDKGYDKSNYTSTFNGTSSAAPVTSGVVALLLSENPNLSWQQVYDVLTGTADKIDTTGGAYVNGRSNIYGFGRVNAFSAVRKARELKGGEVTIETPEADEVFKRDETPSQTDGLADEFTVSVKVGLFRFDRARRRSAYWDYKANEWVSVRGTGIPAALSEATLVSPNGEGEETPVTPDPEASQPTDEMPKTWSMPLPDNLVGGRYEIVAQGTNPSGGVGKMVSRLFSVATVGTRIDSPELNSIWEAGAPQLPSGAQADEEENHLLFAEGVSFGGNDDVQDVAVALVRKNQSGQSVAQWNFGSGALSGEHWLPLMAHEDVNWAFVTPLESVPEADRDYMRAASDETEWGKRLPELQPGKYEIRAATIDNTGSMGDVSVAPFEVINVDGVAQTISLSPTRARGTVGKAITFKASYNHSVSATKLTEMAFRAQMVDDENSRVEIRYFATTNTVSIFNTATGRWMNGYAPGTKVVISTPNGDLDLRKCKLTVPKGRGATTRPWQFTFAFTPRISGFYTTSIQAKSRRSTSAWGNEGTLSVSPGSGSIRRNSADGASSTNPSVKSN